MRRDTNNNDENNGGRGGRVPTSGLASILSRAQPPSMSTQDRNNQSRQQIPRSPFPEGERRPSGSNIFIRLMQERENNNRENDHVQRERAERQQRVLQQHELEREQRQREVEEIHNRSHPFPRPNQNNSQPSMSLSERIAQIRNEQLQATGRAARSGGRGQIGFKERLMSISANNRHSSMPQWEQEHENILCRLPF